jgi:hypothetical protein
MRYVFRVYDVSQAALKFSPICIRHRVCVHRKEAQ